MLLSDLESVECGGESTDGGRGGDDDGGGESVVVVEGIPDMVPANKKHNLLH